MKPSIKFTYVLGALLMFIPLLFRHSNWLPEDAADFIRGLGVAFILGTFILDVKRQRSSSCRNKTIGS